MDQYTVSGMSCAACSARVEKAVSKVPGVTSCAVSLLTNSMGVEGTASAADIIQAVEDAGYVAEARGGNAVGGSPHAPGAADGRAAAARLREQEEALRDTETPKLKKRLLASLCLLVVLMYFSMGHMMFGWPVPALFENHVALALFEMLIAILVMTINGKFFTSGFKSLMHGAPNMDTLVALGSAASFGYSLVELFLMIDAMGKGDSETVHRFSMDLYFEAAAMIPTLITVGKLLEAMSKGRTTDALKGLMQLAPKTAVVLRDGAEVEVSIEEVMTGDLFVVRPGENIPVDGVVVDGESAINEAALTGESIPVDKAPGDSVQAATVNQSGFLTCRATRVGEDTTLAQIIKMVSDAAATKAPLARIADKVSAVFVPTVIGLAILTTVIWMLLDREFGFAFARGVSVLVISCPCALGLATPVAIMVGSGMGAKNGILYKTAQSLEETGRVDIVALDKTGT
ncbi:MAG: heavy metal translocating P-type ATPase, partial [Clostridiales bacterium]|nr:heavy metal translocating P-type ATPase [Clostridiales bacterium]